MFKYTLNQDTELRLLEPRYAQEIFDLIDADRLRLQKWLDWVERTNSVDDTKAYRKLSLELCSQGKSFVVGIWHHGRFAGIVGLEDINAFVGSAEIGYWLGEEFEGQGLVTNTCRAIIAHAFGTLGLNRLQIRVQPSNARSRAIPHRLGFNNEGTLRQVGRICDERIDLEVYSLLREDWEGIPARITFTHPLSENSELRLLMPQDAEEIFSLVDNNREHLRWMIFTEGTRSVENIQEFVKYSLHQLAADTGYHWGIVHQGRMAGIFGADGINRNSQKAEIGYWLAAEFQGKGLMTLTGREMLSHLFNTIGLNRVEVRCDVRNTRSRALAERLGFVYEGTKRQVEKIGGKFVDDHYFALLREEWEVQNAINAS